MATPSFKVVFNLDDKTCTVTDLDPQGTAAQLVVENNGFSNFSETIDFDIENGEIEKTFDLPLISDEIEEATYTFLYSNVYYNPTNETGIIFAWENPSLPQVVIDTDHDCIALTFTTTDITSYSIPGYTVSFDRVIQLTSPPVTEIPVNTLTDDSDAPVGEIEVTGEVLVGTFVTTVTTELTASATDYSFTATLTGLSQVGVTCSLFAGTTVEAMETLYDSYTEALSNNYREAESLKQKLFKLNCENMIYQNYLLLGDVTNAAIHAENIKTLLGIDDE